MIKWLTNIYNRIHDYFELRDLNARNSQYMSQKWNNEIDSLTCPMCKFPLEYDDVYIGQKFVRSIVGCPSCGWIPSEVVE